ncbi:MULTISPECIES: hypothetical protein [unclassified Frankia]|uniref:hypothetical protein n=1 Tax=unclassified Frankia TaxID=2632575 RepID=UPI00202584E1
MSEDRAGSPVMVSGQAGGEEPVVFRGCSEYGPAQIHAGIGDHGYGGASTGMRFACSSEGSHPAAGGLVAFCEQVGCGHMEPTADLGDRECRYCGTVMSVTSRVDPTRSVTPSLRGEQGA